MRRSGGEGPKRDRSSSSHVNRRHRGRRNGDKDGGSQAGRAKEEDCRGLAGVALATVGAHLDTNVLGKVGANRNPSTVAAGNEYFAPECRYQ